MAHLWVQLDGGQWGLLELGEGAYLVDGEGRSGVRAWRGGAAGDGGALLRPRPGGRPWVLLCGAGSGVRVNGHRLLLGLRVLRDRDEIVVGRRRMAYSEERLCRVEPFQGAAAEARCGRCRQPLAKDTPSVRCPTCETWYHQGEDLLCWTYAATCRVCGRSTELTDDYQWHPAGASR